MMSDILVIVGLGFAAQIFRRMYYERRLRDIQERRRRLHAEILQVKREIAEKIFCEPVKLN